MFEYDPTNPNPLLDDTDQTYGQPGGASQPPPAGTSPASTLPGATQPTQPTVAGQSDENKRSQLAKMAAARAGYAGGAAPMPTPNAGDDPQSPMMQQQLAKPKDQKGASSGEIMQLLSMFV